MSTTMLPVFHNTLAKTNQWLTEINDLLAFLHSLTDTTQDLSKLVPEKVPSGLSVADEQSSQDGLEDGTAYVTDTSRVGLSIGMSL